MDRQGLIWTFTLVCILLGFTAVNSLNPTANTPVPEVTSKIGQSANLSCEAHGLPLFACYWKRADKTITFNGEGSRQGKSNDAGYGYIGSGFGRGSCGLQIKNVKEEDNGNWTCQLTDSKTATQYEGSVHLTILKAPEGLRFDPNINKIESLIDAEPNAKVNITCGSYNGQPAPKYKWFIGNDSITDGLLPYDNFTDGGRHWVYQTLDYKYTAKDNGKNIRCVLEHDALNKNDHKEVAHKIGVLYKPRADPTPTATFVPKLGEDVVIQVNISSNPKPSVLWKIGEAVSVIPPQSTPDKKYTAKNLVQHPTLVGVWTAELLIKNVQEEDLSKTYRFEATNLYGNDKYDLRLTASDPEAGGISTGGIVGLVLGIPVILIIISVLIVYTRAKGLLCFKGMPIEMDINRSATNDPTDLTSGGTDNEGYPPVSSTPPLNRHSKYSNGNTNIPPPAPSIPPPPLDDNEVIVYTNGHGRSVKDSPV